MSSVLPRASVHSAHHPVRMTPVVSLPAAVLLCVGLAATTAFSGLICGAHVQVDPAPRPDSAADGKPVTSPLAGPKTSPESTEVTLIVRDIAGKVQRLEMSPEQAAIEKLKLDPETKAKVGEILGARAAKIDKFVVENIPLLTELGSAANSTNKADLAGVLFRMASKLRPVLQDTPLQLQLSRALSEPDAARFNTLVDGYWQAIADERSAERGRPKRSLEGTTPSESGGKRRLDPIADERLKSLGKEIELSFKRSLYGGGLAYSYIMKGITVKPEQEARIREYFADHGEATKAGENDEANKKLFWRVYGELDNDQRKVALQNVAELTGKKPKIPARSPAGKTNEPKDAEKINDSK